MSAPLSQPSQRASAAELVADRLMQLIVSGSLSAGESLRETQLAARLGISRNSLREGIRLLEQSRLVKYVMHRGAVVSTPTVHDLEDLYRTRLHIELAAARMTPKPSQLKSIDDAFAALEKSTQSLDANTIVAADLALHQAFVRLLDSERISAFYEQLCKELVFYFTVLSYADEEYVNPEEPIVQRHKNIYDAVRADQPDLAAKLTEEHILENFERLKEILTARENNSNQKLVAPEAN